MKKVIALLIFIFPASVQAVGINTDNAIPVAKQHFVIRTQARYAFADDDPSGGSRRLHQLQFPTVLVYGATTKTALFAMAPLVLRWLYR